MKKIYVLVFLSLFSGLSLAGGKFTSKDGYLVLPDISVDDKSFYDTVTLQLNFSNGTFSYISSNPKPTTLFDKPVEPQVTDEGFTVGSLGCKKTASTKVSCYLQIVNNNADATVRLWLDSSYKSQLFDNLNNTYLAKSGMISAEETTSGYVSSILFQGIPAKIRIDFEDINATASSVSALKPAIGYTAKGKSEVIFYPTFKDIKF
ncbi:MAG: hypothetical protein ABL903_04715 [Methylococcales bacterium]